MAFNLWHALLATALLICLSPGAGAITSMSYGLNHGMRNAVFAVLGFQIGFALRILVVGVGLGSVIATSDSIFLINKWFGVVYLIWLGTAAGVSRLSCWKPCVSWRQARPSGASPQTWATAAGAPSLPCSGARSA